MDSDNKLSQSLAVRLEEAKANLRKTDSDLRMQAVRDLVSFRDISVLPLLTEAAEREADVQIRYEIRKAIGILKHLQTAPKQPAAAEPGVSANLRKVEESLLSEDLEQVNKAFRYIMQYRLKQFLPLMQKVAKERDSAYQRSLVVRFMQLIGGEHYFQDIVAYLGDNDPRVVSTAIEALEAIGNTKALAYLAQCVTHSHNRVQASAMKALYSLGDQTALNLFEKMVASPHSEYRNSAAYALKEMKIEKGIPLLGRLLQDTEESVRAKAQEGLLAMAQAGNELAQAILSGESTDLDLVQEERSPLPPYPLGQSLEVKLEWLRGIPNDASSLFRDEIILVLPQEHEDRAIASLVMALARFAHPDSCAALIPMLSHKVDRVRANAVEALGRLLPIQERQVLLPCLEDSNNRVLGNAILALFPKHENESLGALQYLAESANRNEQLTAVFCIGALEKDSCLRHAEYLLESQYSDVREKILTVLERLSQDSSLAMRLLKQNRLRMAMFEPQHSHQTDPPGSEIVSPSAQLSVSDVPQTEEPRTEKPQTEATQPEIPVPVIKSDQAPQQSAPPKPTKKDRVPQAVAKPVSAGPWWDELESASSTVFGSVLCILVALISLRLLVAADSTYQNFILVPLKTILIGETIHYTIFCALMPLSLLWFVLMNLEVLLKVRFLTGFLVGLFLCLWIPALNYFHLSSGQMLNFMGFYSAQTWFDPYSHYYRLALLLCNLPWLVLACLVEGLLTISDQTSRFMISVGTFFTCVVILFMGAFNSTAYLELEQRKWLELELYTVTQLQKIRTLEEDSRYQELRMQNKIMRAAQPMEKRLAEIRLGDVQKERQRLQNEIFSLEARLKEIRRNL